MVTPNQTLTSLGGFPSVKKADGDEEARPIAAALEMQGGVLSSLFSAHPVWLVASR
jgi:hypothetical protein